MAGSTKERVVEIGSQPWKAESYLCSLKDETSAEFKGEGVPSSLGKGGIVRIRI